MVEVAIVEVAMVEVAMVVGQLWVATVDYEWFLGGYQLFQVFMSNYEWLLGSYEWLGIDCYKWL